MEPQRAKLVLDKPAIYRIVLQGHLEKGWSDYAGGLTISTRQDENQNPITILVGQVKDQAMLMGILTNVYNWHHLPLLSVECISIEENPVDSEQRVDI